MRMRMFILTFLAVGSASAATITFENATVDPQPAPCETVSDGFRFFDTEIICGQVYTLSIPDSTNSLHHITYFDAAFGMESLSGDNFALHSIDVASIGGPAVTLTGFYAAGGTIQATFLSVGEWNTFALDDSWQNLERIEFFIAGEAFGASIDNLVVSTVPVPAAFWLFGSAIAALGYSRRRAIAP